MFGRSDDQDQMVAVTKSIAEMESNLTEMMRGMHEMQRQLQQQQLNLTQIITNIVSVSKICAHSAWQIALQWNPSFKTQKLSKAISHEGLMYLASCAPLKMSNYTF